MHAFGSKEGDRFGAPREKKSKHKQGDIISSLNELAEQEFIYFQNKLYHKGWFTSWQFSWCIRWIKLGAFRKAVKIDE